MKKKREVWFPLGDEAHLKLRKMKLTAILLILVFAGFGNSFSQVKLTASFSKADIREVLQTIEEKTDYIFLYKDQIFDFSQKISAEFNDAKFEDVLKTFCDQTKISYEIRDRQIILKEKELQGVPGTQQMQQKKDLSGKVKDNTGNPLPGVSVIVKGTSSGTITDTDGQFKLSVPGNAKTLVFSFIGMRSQEIEIGDQKVINITLTEETVGVEEVVVVGYGAQKKVNLTGALSTVKMDDVLGDRPVSNTMKALQGTIPGLQVNFNNNKPGSDYSFNIRGVTSVNGGGPLVLVDNVPMSTSWLDPNEIESVTVLKDAAASAIYGARAAYGVILITTKQGKKGTPIRFDYNNNFTFSTPAAFPEKASVRETVGVYKDNTYIYTNHKPDKWLQYLDEYDQGKYPDGVIWDANDNLPYYLRETDVFKDMTEKFGFQQQHNLAVSGGSEKATYRMSFGMVDQDGVLITNRDAYRRYNASAFVSMDVNKWMTTQADFRYTDAVTSTAAAYDGTYSGYDSAWTSAMYQSPSWTPLGYGLQTPASTELLPYGSPGNRLLLGAPKIDKSNNTRILGRMILKPFKDFEFVGEYSFNRSEYDDKRTQKMFRYIVAETNFINNSTPKSKYESTQYYTTRNAINAYATYTKTIGAHNIKFMGGYNQENYYYDFLTANREDLINQDLPSINLSSGTIIANDNFEENALRSLFYRANYSYKERYLLEANGRYDGSSRFGKAARFGFFPSFSAGWRVTEEPFMQPVKQVINNMKIRGSWGTIGNQNVGSYAYLPNMGATKPSWILPGAADKVTSITTPGLISSSYTWEEVSTLDLGADISVLNERLSLTFDWYQRETKGMLQPSQPLPDLLGTSAPRTNAADLRTKGWELSINWNDQIGDVKYQLGFNLYDSRAIVTRYQNLSGLLLNGNSLYLREGMEFGEIWGYSFDRFYTSEDFDNNYTLLPGIAYAKNQKTYSPVPGDILFKDLGGGVDGAPDGIISDGNNTLENHGDLSIIGNQTPRFQFGLNGGASWKNFDFSFVVDGVAKRDLYSANYWPAIGQFETTVFKYQLDYWKADRTDALFPRVQGMPARTITTPTGNVNVALSNSSPNDGYNRQRQDRYLLNGSYIKIKSLGFGYTLPKNLCTNFNIQKLRVFVNLENVFTFHHLPTGWQPDVYSANPGALSMNAGRDGDSGFRDWSYPEMRQFSVGLNLSF